LQELENKTVESFSNSSITCYIIIVIVEQFGSLLESQQQAVKLLSPGTLQCLHTCFSHELLIV